MAGAVAQAQAQAQGQQGQVAAHHGDLLDLLGDDNGPQSAATASSMDLFAGDHPLPSAAPSAAHSSLLDMPSPGAAPSAAPSAAAPPVDDDDPFAALASGRAVDASAPSEDVDFFSQAPQSSSGGGGGAASSTSMFGSQPIKPSTATAVPPPASRYDAFKM
eukprot:TRINITY_DN11766_c1_g2_i1.p2 TRINITY_DN11766_c1_g2~~TRINITY_DN11766_c1_g2_i1.p2  ORF type:complete len:161 (-),score=54.15 TRINITY_DN11766_c1_g2_i1:310-792(-)